MTIDCIDYIYDGEQIYYAKDATEESMAKVIVMEERKRLGVETNQEVIIKDEEE